MRRWWWAVALGVLVPLCCCGGGCWTVVLPMFLSRGAIEKARARCVELGHPPEQLVLANYNWSGGGMGASEVSVSFLLAGSKPTKFVHVALRRAGFGTDWEVTGVEEQVLPEKEPEKDQEDRPGGPGAGKESADGRGKGGSD